MPAPPSANLLDVFEAPEVPYLARLRQKPRLLRPREQFHMPMVVGRGFFIITSMVSRQISPLDLYGRRACAEDAMGQWIRAVPPHLSSANRPKQTTQGRPVHNACERFDTIDAKEANEPSEPNEPNEPNLLSALRKPRPAATGKSWQLDKVRERICKVDARFTFSGRRVVMAIAGTARAIWRALWPEVEKIRLHPRSCPDGRLDQRRPTNRQLGESGPWFRRAETANDSAERGRNVAIRPPIGGLMNKVG